MTEEIWKPVNLPLLVCYSFEEAIEIIEQGKQKEMRNNDQELLKITHDFSQQILYDLHNKKEGVRIADDLED